MIKLFYFEALQLNIYYGFIRYLMVLVVIASLKEHIWSFLHGVSFIVAAGCANRRFPSVFNVKKLMPLNLQNKSEA